MQLARFVRPRRFLLVLGLAGFLLGCSGQSTAPSMDQETKIATKKTIQERNAERKEAMKERMKGR
jgi:hypothetical protein